MSRIPNYGGPSYQSHHFYYENFAEQQSLTSPSRCLGNDFNDQPNSMPVGYKSELIMPDVIQPVSQLLHGHAPTGTTIQSTNGLVGSTQKSPSSSTRNDPGYGYAIEPAVQYVQKIEQQCDQPSHGGPSHQSCNINHIDYGPYTNHGQHASGRGTINNYQTANPLIEELRIHCSPSAAFDSAARFNPPRCAESTRLGIIQAIGEWIDSDADNPMPSSLFWLHGGAGVGKSALAQSLSEKFQAKNQLGASFFFFRSDPARNNGAKLIPTLISHLLNTFKGIVPFVEDRIRENWDLFTKIYDTQIEELLVKPLLALKSTEAQVTHPRLIVIDGLDECENEDVQCQLLRVIACAIRRIPYPLRFLVTSRPETHIADVFNHDCDLQAVKVHRYNLSYDPDADIDIRKFLEKEFEEIRRVHRLGQYLPHIWPDQEVITSLVERSSQHFIYASTVIRYIQSRKHRPDNRLEVILRLRPPREGDRPYAQLDALYALIFACVEDHQLQKICLILGTLYFRSKSVGIFSNSRNSISPIETLLGMKAGDLVLLLDPILSLVAIDDQKVRILHKSLFDYLQDPTRRGSLPFDLARVHELAATRFLKENNANNRGLKTFAFHCRYGYLNDELKDYLHDSLDAPFPKSVISNAHFPGESVMWDCLRIMSREDLDSTGHIHERYVAKWMDYFQSATPWHSQCESRVGVNPENLKRQIDKLLMEWKPQDFNPKTVGVTPVNRVAIIKRELSVFTAYAEASFSGSAIASSLVFGDYFIHSYNLAIFQNGYQRLLIQTYSRHDDLYHQELLKVDDPVLVIEKYLRNAEKCLFSDSWQKYGIFLD